MSEVIRDFFVSVLDNTNDIINYNKMLVIS